MPPRLAEGARPRAADLARHAERRPVGPGMITVSTSAPSRARSARRTVSSAEGASSSISSEGAASRPSSAGRAQAPTEARRARRRPTRPPRRTRAAAPSPPSRARPSPIRRRARAAPRAIPRRARRGGPPLRERAGSTGEGRRSGARRRSYHRHSKGTAAVNNLRAGDNRGASRGIVGLHGGRKLWIALWAKNAAAEGLFSLQRGVE